jgi:8-oxo-dGTP diphosphatase
VSAPGHTLWGMAYRKGTDPHAEMARVRDAFSEARAAIWASYDIPAAWAKATELVELIRDMQSDAARLRAQVAYSLMVNRALTVRQLAQALSISDARAGQLAALGREEGITMTEPADRMELPAVALAIVTGPRGVLIEERRDGIPPVTFPGGEILSGETPADAVSRRVPEETGIPVIPTVVIGRRIHPKTGRLIIYVQASPARDAEPELLDTEDLSAVRWAPVDEVLRLAPDIFGPVRDYLTGKHADQ